MKRCNVIDYVAFTSCEKVLSNFAPDSGGEVDKEGGDGSPGLVVSHIHHFKIEEATTLMIEVYFALSY